METLNPDIFREYDIRGIVGTDLTNATVEVLGRAWGTWIRKSARDVCVVGRDCRISSPAFAEALIRGITACGVRVKDIGIVPTPLLYFSMFHLDIDCGVMITGSHNPKNFNGFKVCANKSALYGSDIAEVGRIASSGDFADGQGEVSHADVINAYMDKVASGARLGSRSLKVVVDAGNGTGGVVAIPLFQRLGIDAVPLYCEMDGEFPNHHPDPTVPSNLDDLSRKVIETGADLGIAFDGDADRIGVVTETGEVIYGDMILLILALALLRDNPGAEIVSEVKCSQVLFDEIEKAGGRAVMWKVGHSLIKAKMAEDGALLGGEMSGHMFFRHRWYGFDDAIYSAIRFLEVLSAGDQPASRLLEGVPVMKSTPEIRLDCPDGIKFKVVDAMTDLFKSRHSDVIDVDGVRVRFPHGWGLVRSSNTQPVLVFRFEADSDEALENISTAMMSKAEEFKKRLMG
ncbi:MAG: phosphomannomutase/phosphoglucomutase [Deltaproteobacteria bacterium]|nr:phosphomannomutase/phosphoglucomutase [Deltaproteobacteria bacterium]